MQTICGIYKIVQISRGRVVYVGSSNNVNKRIIGHRWSLNKNDHHNPFLQRTWNKYGKDDFVFNIIESVELDRLIDREQYWLDKLQPTCNISRVAGRSLWGRVVTEETRRKIGLGHKGKKLSDAQKARLREHNLGRIPSAETREKLSLAHKGRKHTEEARRNMSKAQQAMNVRLGRIPKKDRVKKERKKIGPMRSDWKLKIGEANKRIAEEKKRKGIPVNHQSAKTHCPHGHAYTDENVIRLASGARGCRECNKVNCSQRYYANRDKISQQRREKARLAREHRKRTAYSS